jgi:hypothetical protein
MNELKKLPSWGFTEFYICKKCEDICFAIVVDDDNIPKGCLYPNRRKRSKFELLK